MPLQTKVFSAMTTFINKTLKYENTFVCYLDIWKKYLFTNIN